MVDFDKLQEKIDEIVKDTTPWLMSREEVVRQALNKLGLKKIRFVIWDLDNADGYEMADKVFSFMEYYRTKGKNFECSEVYFLDDYNKPEEFDFIITYEKKGK